ncbi:MAG: hypothetical protein HKN78_10185 [Sphingomonadaceae bacterium]|nr:hypothetical protein [Sphingomonadaceae bacterium]
MALLLISALAACGRIIPPGAESRPAPQRPAERPAPPVSPPVEPGENALSAGIFPGPPVDELVQTHAGGMRAFHAFRLSCPTLVNRPDLSRLTIQSDWAPACEAARQLSHDDAREFFAEYFRAVQIGDGAAFATGYYEPSIAAAREERPDYRWPIYGVPEDLGRVANGDQPLYLDRAAIEAGALAGQGLEIGWARDLVDLFFLQVQGSGVLEYGEGDVQRIGYAANNGHPYTSIGAILRDRNLVEPGQLTAEGIADWLRAHPEQGRAIMQENKRYIFFRPLDTPAPLGSLGYPVTPRATLAADPAYAPPGAPVFLDMEHDIADGLWVVQDTGSAIRGPNRFDTYWGSGADAFEVASGMASRGRAYILIPRVSAERLSRAD